MLWNLDCSFMSLKAFLMAFDAPNPNNKQGYGNCTYCLMWCTHLTQQYLYIKCGIKSINIKLMSGD